MAAPELNKIEIGNELSTEELSLIQNLDLKAFNIDAQIDDINELKDNLKTSKINIITSAPDAETETKEEKTLVEVATAFDQYVEKGEGWKLKVKEGATDTPQWVKYIIENPNNNDLAYFVQKLAGLIEYQTAKAYTQEQIDAVTVSVDKTFGNQTKRALSGLKTWIENDQDYKTITDGTTYTGKYLAKTFVEGVISDKTSDEEKTTALTKYNLQYLDDKIQPKEGYEFIDPYSNNLAVKVVGSSGTSNTYTGVVNIEKYDAKITKYDQFDETDLTGLKSILENNKKDIVDILKGIDIKYLGNYASLIGTIDVANVSISNIDKDNLKIKIGSLALTIGSIEIPTSSIINENMEYNKENLKKAIEENLINTYIQEQYKNIPTQTKTKVYNIDDSNNIKIQTFIKENDFNNLNVLSYTTLEDGNIIFKLPDKSNNKTIKNLDKLKAIKIDVKKVVTGNNVDLDKLKVLLDVEITKVVGVDISNLSVIREKEENEILSVIYGDYTYTFNDENTKAEFLRTINNTELKTKDGVIYDPPSSSITKDKLWYIVKGGKVYKYGTGHNRENARVFNGKTNSYESDKNKITTWSGVDRFTT